MTLLDRQIEIANHLISGFPELGLRGWHLAGACAVVGNYTQENLCKAVTTGPLDHGSQGIAQWRLARLTDLQEWCGKNFGDWKTLKAQSAFTLYEIARDYPALDAELRKGMEGVNQENVRKVLDYKTEKFCFDFERPNKALAGLANRKRHAASVYMVMSGVKPPVAVSRPKAPPLVTNGGVVIAGGAATGGAAVANNSGASDIISIMLFGFAMAVAIVTIYLMRPKKKISPTAAQQVSQAPLDRLTAALEWRALANAEVAEAADALRDYVQGAKELVAMAGESIRTIEYQEIKEAPISPET